MNANPTTWAELDAANKADGHYSREPQVLADARYAVTIAWREHSEIIDARASYPTEKDYLEDLSLALAHALAADDWYRDLYRAHNSGIQIPALMGV